MGRENRIVGGRGEGAALRFLKRRGYRILGTNIRTPFGELDIVASVGGVIVFVEVKARRGYSLGPPYLSVTRLKEGHLIRNALFYLKGRGRVDSDWRIDIVSVQLDPNGGVEQIELIENAVQNNDY